LGSRRSSNSGVISRGRAAFVRVSDDFLIFRRFPTRSLSTAVGKPMRSGLVWSSPSQSLRARSPRQLASRCNSSSGAWLCISSKARCSRLSYASLGMVVPFRYIGVSTRPWPCQQARPRMSWSEEHYLCRTWSVCRHCDQLLSLSGGSRMARAVRLLLLWQSGPSVSVRLRCWFWRQQIGAECLPSSP